MRCDNCKHWDKEGRDLGEVKVQLCNKTTMLWGATEWTKDSKRVLKAKFAGQKMFVQDASDYSAELYTTADFFCAHFEQKSTEPSP